MVFICCCEESEDSLQTQRTGRCARRIIHHPDALHTISSSELGWRVHEDDDPEDDATKNEMVFHENNSC
jgi:hypothetical protein